MTIRDVESAMAEKPRGVEFIVVGDLNVELGETGRRVRYEDITAALAAAGLEDMAGHHFFPRIRVWCQDWRTLSMRRQGKAVRSRTDYILGSDRRIFQNVAVQDPRHNSYHFMVMGSLHGASPREHSNFLGSRTQLPLIPPGNKTRTRADELFTELRRAVPKRGKLSSLHNLRISEETWRLVDKRFSTRREPERYQQRLRRLARAIRYPLKEYRRRRVTTAGEAVESLFTWDPPLPREAWRRMRGWY